MMIAAVVRIRPDMDKRVGCSEKNRKPNSMAAAGSLAARIEAVPASIKLKDVV